MSDGGIIVLVGAIVHSISLGELEMLSRGALVADNGVILRVVDLTKKNCSLEELCGELKNSNTGRNVVMRDFGESLIMPGFIDTHCHAPQYVFTGTGMDLPLLQWLEKYTFPCESRFNDEEFARKAYKRSVKAHLANGSTFCSYFATIHTPAAIALAEVCEELGQRAYIGKVSMDRNSPDFYIEETSKGCKDAELFVRTVLAKSEKGQAFLDRVDSGSPPALMNDPQATPLILPAITPRFVPTCTAEMMAELGRIGAKYSVPMQSHLSENKDECAWVASLHPDIKGYARVYDEYNLLNDKTCMAHCVYSDLEERALMKKNGCGVSHCASSNFSLCSGVMDVRVFLQEGLKVGLGTDVAGGYSCSMLDAMRQSLTASIVSSIRRRDANEANNEGEGEPLAPLSYQEAFYLATMGGAEVLNMDKVVGNFAPGKRMDALVVDLNVADSPVDIFDFETLSEKFQKFIYLANDRNITHIYVDGRLVKSPLP